MYLRFLPKLNGQTSIITRILIPYEYSTDDCFTQYLPSIHGSPYARLGRPLIGPARELAFALHNYIMGHYVLGGLDSCQHKKKQ